jgi:hypothetical protein
MARSTRISQNKPFPNSKNVRRGAGPMSYQWSPTPFQKKSETQKGLIGCNGYIDNITTYVYNILNNGDHLAYVNCDYVV